ncbi:MAG: M48 family metallopeptidase [Syntrophaceae bacterium]|nr:M48 family metallopeptidase [Syntrophaceae bacterium]
MAGEIEGTYMDGRTAERHRAVVVLTPQGLQITLENRKSLYWPLEEVRQSKNFYGERQVRLERGQNTPEVLLVPASLFLLRMKEVSPQKKKGFRPPPRSRRWVWAVIFSAAGAIGVTVFLYLWGIPALADSIAPHIPVSWEERLGQSVVDALAPIENRCTNGTGSEKIQEILDVLKSSVPHSPYRFRAIVVNGPAVNALAAPGGTVLIFRGLLEKTNTPEELAGVLAHEMHHILQRHATRALLQQVSMKILLAAAVGDARGLSFGLEGAQALGTLRYSRQKEGEADRGAIQMLIASGIDPRGLWSFFETVKKDSAKSLKLPSYLSTHPDLEERIERLKALTAKAPIPKRRLLPGYNWKNLHQICQAQ